MAEPKKNKSPEYGQFEQLTRKLVGVSKEELDKKVSIYNAKKDAAKNKPKKR